MRHKWDEGNWFMGVLYSTCEVCNGVRMRGRVPDQDYINTPSMNVDTSLPTRRGWVYDDATPRSCPGEPIDFDTAYGDVDDEGDT